MHGKTKSVLLKPRAPEMLNKKSSVYFQYVPQDMINDMNGVEVLNEETQYNKTYYD